METRRWVPSMRDPLLRRREPPCLNVLQPERHESRAALRFLHRETDQAERHQRQHLPGRPAARLVRSRLRPIYKPLKLIDSNSRREFNLKDRVRIQLLVRILSKQKIQERHSGCRNWASAKGPPSLKHTYHNLREVVNARNTASHVPNERKHFSLAIFVQQSGI